MLYPFHTRLPFENPLASQNVAYTAGCVALTVRSAVLASAAYGAPARYRTRDMGKVTGLHSRGLRQRWGD
jgi:hypothetical protein